MPERDSINGQRVGIYIQARDTLDAITRIREAEQAGVKHAWMASGGAGFADVLTVLGMVALQTETITLGTAVVPAPTRHPLVMAQQALAVHDIAPQRLRLGIGSGNPLFLEKRYGLAQRAPLSYLKEYLEILHGVLWKGEIDYQGAFLQVTDSLPRIAPVPLMISTLGLKSFQLAGELADGALTSLCPVPYLLEQALPALRAGARAKSRPTPPMIVCLPVALSTDEVAVNAAVQRLIKILAGAEAHARMFALAGWSSSLQGDESALRDLAHELVISGNEEAVRQRIHELLASGLDELLLLPIPIADEAGERKQLLNLIASL